MSYLPNGALASMGEPFKRFALIGVAASLIAGCDQHGEPKSAGVRVGSSKAAGVIPDFIDYLRQNKVLLEKDPRFSGDWKVVGPPSDDTFDVVVCLEEFPPEITASQMELEILTTNMAFRLNAPARLAMSYPHYRGRPGVDLGRVPDPLSLPISEKLLHLFDTYKSPQSAGKTVR